MSDIAVKIDNISKYFDKIQILDNINLEIKTGEIFGLIALNGTGKTTLIKVILDLIKADSGDVEFFGVNYKSRLSREKIIFLPEKFRPPELLTGLEFLKLSLQYSNKKLNQNKINTLIKDLDFPNTALNKKIKNYSKGMGQKLGLIASFLSEADLYILDEPMSGLDPKARILLKKYILSLKNQGKTIFFSSHLLADMKELCSRVAILNNKQLNFVGTPDEFNIKYNSDNLEESFLKALEN